MDIALLITNPCLISVVLLCVLCILKINVLFSLMICSVAAGLMAQMDIKTIMDTFISGLGKNAETALSYILLGTLAAAMTHTGLASILSCKISNFIKGSKYLLILILTVISIMSQNLIPVHIAFIPILIPPLLGLMNKLKLDRRLAACSLVFGLKAPYITIPMGFGLIFQGLIADNITQNGLPVLKSEVWRVNWILGLGMLIALLIAIFISYRKPRVYKDSYINSCKNDTVIVCDSTPKNVGSIAGEIAKDLKKELKKEHYVTLLGALVALIVQIVTSSLPLGALLGLGVIFGFRAISHKKMDELLNEGVGLMGYIAFVMLVCGGFALVLAQTGSIDNLVDAILPCIGFSKFLTAFSMLIIGLLITMGIGSSFGTIPILAVLFVPVCTKLGFSSSSIIVLLSAAAALGDAGSPASETTLGPTAGLNCDGQHNHIKDTCIPTFLHYNTALIIAALVAVYIFK